MQGDRPVGAWRRAPLGLLGMIVLVALVERQLDRHPLQLNENTPTSWRFARTQARRVSKGRQVLCFGSSLVKFGVLPAIVAEKTGRPCYNLAVYGGRMASSYYLFKRALEAGARPAAVVVDCHDGPVPRSKARELNEAVASNSRNWPEVLRLGEAVELAWHVGDPNFLAATTLAWAFPSIKARHEVRAHLMARLEGKEPPAGHNNLVLLRNWNANQGAQVMPATAPAAEAVATLDGPAADLPEGEYLPNPFMDVYVGKFLDLARDHKVPVFWVFAPLSPAILTMQHNTGFERFATDCANTIQKRYANVIVVDARRSGYSTGAFLDATHLNVTGNASLSEDLGAVIAERLSGKARGSRWVFLPKYRPRSPNPSTEDFQRSWLAVASRASKRF